MSTPPDLLTVRSALFLDFDGTLAELAPRPDAVVIPNELLSLLERLHVQLGGAVALITGRAQADIEPLIAPLQLPAAYEHGAVRRAEWGMVSLAPDQVPDLGPALAAAHALAARHQGLLVEHKHTAMALHFRLAPELETECVDAMLDAVQHNPGLQLLRGKAVVEVKSASVNKGHAIQAFMAEAPFKGRLPVFAGDDVTDEAGFEVVQRLGGAGIKVGVGHSCALHRIADPQALRAWLAQTSPEISSPR
ncbi:MAG TPA: trehalose-phosphatase [Hydrogenophaga sp.]|nr:trehalose-phosphatase [Hydrogenophaga sp.]